MMSEEAFVKMPSGKVFRFDPVGKVLSGLVSVGEPGSFLTHGDWNEVIDLAVTGQPYAHIQDLAFKPVGENVFEFRAGLLTDPTGEDGFSWSDLDGYVKSLGMEFKLLECEQENALGCEGNEYPDETVVKLSGGREVRCPSSPQDVGDYVRVCLGGVELAYWHHDDLREAPVEVMSALISAMRNGQAGSLTDR